MAERRRVELVPAYVLHRRAYRDTSLLVELLARDHGRIGAVARGARRGRLAPLVQPFRPLLVSWTGRGELATITALEEAGAPVRIDGARLVSGFYANEILLRLLQREDPHSEIFDAYARLLGLLAASEHAEGAVLRTFERDLLDALGYGLSLHEDVDGRPLDPGTCYRYQPEHGPVAVTMPEGGGLYVRGRSLLSLAAGLPDAVAERELRPLLRRILTLYIGERPLRSRELYASYLATSRRTTEP